MSAQIDLFWSFRSPYSYLAMPGALDVAERYDVEIQLRPVLPLAVRSPEFFDANNQSRVRYIGVDYPRRAALLGMHAGWPSPDPIVQDMTTFEIAKEQPYIHRLVYLGVEAQRRGRGLQFAYEVSQLLFGGTRDWDQGDHLAQAAARAGLDLDSMEEAIADPASHREEVEASHEALDASGHSGVPNFVYNGEPFFGQDRIDSLCFQLDRDGLARRAKVEAVLFDFGGVFTDSPFHAVHAFGAELGLSDQEVTAIVFGSYEHDGDHPWHQLERGEITLENARELILARGREHDLEVDIYELFSRMAGNNAGADERLPLVERVRGLKQEGYVTGIITNNVAEFGDGWRGLIPVDELFDFVVDSSSVGVRKPDPRIFALALEQLDGIEARNAVFLDDYQANVDAARELGLQAITVGTDLQACIRELDELLGS